MTDYGSFADDYYVNMNLNTEMALPAARETVLGFFERVQKSYPSMRNFYTRENGDFVLEEDKESGCYRWVTIESRRVGSGYVNPPSPDQAIEQHLLVLDLIPFMLSVSPLDCEALDLMYGFDFMYRGNHDLLVAEALGLSPAMESILSIPGARPINYEPNLTMALDEACRRQARVMVETRTNAYHVRRAEYPEENLSVYSTVRQYGSLSGDSAFKETLVAMSDQMEWLLNGHVVQQVLKPLQQAISTR